MSKRQLIVTVVIASVICGGCSPAYRFVKVDKTSGGYMVKKGKVDMPYFTIDESQQYPKDLKLAKRRFKNRRLLVERYYKEEFPELFGGPFMMGVKFLTFYAFIPIAGLLMDYYQDRPCEEIEEQDIKQFIEEESKKEPVR
ncbi:MAG: hypothetical protein JSV34_02325 [Candidatus Omnitrophota bacterium]|nr:MAG: hypothetical protein JSV34_02325 [Candidatus Omnitrophota bacterium]